MLTHAEIMLQLYDLAEPEYAKFSSALVPGCPSLLGVRLPALRSMAKELAKDFANNPAAVFEALPNPAQATFEERMLRGMVIGYAKMPDAKRLAMLEAFLPLIDNWSICDSTAITCKFMAKAPDFWLPWLYNLALRNDEFAARFGIVCLLDHFTATPEGRRRTLQACAAAPCPAPYTRLAIAWAISVVAVKEPALGLEFLQNDTLDAATHNKAIQKTRESYRAAPDYKQTLKTLRR